MFSLRQVFSDSDERSDMFVGSLNEATKTISEQEASIELLTGQLKKAHRIIDILLPLKEDNKKMRETLNSFLESDHASALGIRYKVGNVYFNQDSIEEAKLFAFRNDHAYVIDVVSGDKINVI